MFDLIVNAISNPYVLSLIAVSVWNALNDTTTEGILNDSDAAMTYEIIKSSKSFDNFIKGNNDRL